MLCVSSSRCRTWVGLLSVIVAFPDHFPGFCGVEALEGFFYIYRDIGQIHKVIVSNFDFSPVTESRVNKCIKRLD